MVQYIDKSALVAEIKDLYEDIDKCIGDLVLARSKHDQRGISDAHWKMETLMVNTQQVLSYILQYLEVKEIQEEPVSEELEDASRNYADDEEYGDDIYFAIKAAFEAGAKWKVENLLKPADGDDLPDIDREVVALLDNGKVVFAHRPPEYWDGKNIITGKVRSILWT